MSDDSSDRLQPGIRYMQAKLQEVSDYLENMGPTVRMQSAWQPIETAPKDGTVVLGWEPRASKWKIKFMTFHYSTGGSGYWTNAIASGAVAATHWMPMPEPPSA